MTRRVLLLVCMHIGCPQRIPIPAPRLDQAYRISTRRGWRVGFSTTTSRYEIRCPAHPLPPTPDAAGAQPPDPPPPMCQGCRAAPQLSHAIGHSWIAHRSIEHLLRIGISTPAQLRHAVHDDPAFLYRMTGVTEHHIHVITRALYTPGRQQKENP